jgi:hypothetical protein
MKPLPPGEQESVTIPLDAAVKAGMGAWRKLTGFFRRKKEKEDVLENIQLQGRDSEDRRDDGEG